jgi:hypothetical protein
VFNISSDSGLFQVPLNISVAEPELVEQQLFAGGGAKVFWTGSGDMYVNSYKKCYKNPKFFRFKFEVDLKNHNLVAIYFKELVDNHLCMNIF